MAPPMRPSADAAGADKKKKNKKKKKRGPVD
jgi:hypothetical protein